MSDIAIRVENLSKRYHIGRAQQRHDTLRDALMAGLRTPLERLRRNDRGSGGHTDDTIWALRDVSFEVKHGEVLGIIGRNGAGKSTLLKILSQITEPTTGQAEIYGRVGSLLEVGTGFHPELTGRENIFLNGAILGMRRTEIDRNFDEIVAFAEIEKFLDTPVKRYSSGMYVRLAFAVAAHLEPEILLVDEVLAVGDAAFQKRCLGKMGDVAKEGRTVLFVSHNMVALQSLCERAIWLHGGQLKEEGEAAQVVSNYLHSNTSSLTERVWDDIKSSVGNDIVRLHRVCVRPENGSPTDPITVRTPLVLEFEFWNLVPDAYLNAYFQLVTEQQVVAFASAPIHEPVWSGRPCPVGLFRSVCYIPGDLLNAGLHHIHLHFVESGRIIYRHEGALSFDVQDSSERRGSWYGKTMGAVRPLLKWSTELVSSGAEFELSVDRNVEQALGE